MPGTAVGSPLQPAKRREGAAFAEHAREYTIAELAREFGVTVRALRFYESRRLLSPRRVGKSRLYSSRDRNRLAFILNAKQLGFTLRDIAELMAAQVEEPDHRSLRLSRQQCTEQINLLERQKRRIETALTELRRAYSSHYLRSLEEIMSSEH
jgi:DNA-binding transcriptional MerR regulator